MRLYLVRHGETEFNRLGLFQGHSDALLTAKGILQAEKIGDYFRSYTFDLALVSTLPRCQTTFHVARLYECSKETVHTRLLWEINYGIYEEDRPNRFTIQPKTWTERYQGGESYADLNNRIEKAFKKYIDFDWKEDREVLVLSHGITSRAIRGFISGLSESNTMKTRMQSNDEIIRITIDDKGITSRTFKIR